MSMRKDWPEGRKQEEDSHLQADFPADEQMEIENPDSDIDQELSEFVKPSEWDTYDEGILSYRTEGGDPMDPPPVERKRPQSHRQRPAASGRPSANGNGTLFVLIRLGIALVLFVLGFVITTPAWLHFVLYFVAAVLCGYDILIETVKNLLQRKFRLEDATLVMVLVCIVAFAIGRYPDAAMVLWAYRGSRLVLQWIFQCAQQALAGVEDETHLGERRSELQYRMQKGAAKYIYIVAGLAVIVALLPPLLFQLSYTSWIARGLVFLIVACPGMVLPSISIAYRAGIRLAKGQDIVIKGAGTIDGLATTDTVVFDKTGTLTTGGYTVAGTDSKKLPEEKLLELAAYAEYRSNHPIGQAIVAAYTGSIRPKLISEFQEQPGEGVRVRIGGIPVTVGSPAFLKRLGISVPAIGKTGKTTVLVAVSEECVGQIRLEDQVQTGAAEVVQALKDLGIDRTVLITGDKRDVAMLAAETLGIEEFYAECRPEIKEEKIDQLLAMQVPGKSLSYVGSGADNASVLALADVGILVGEPQPESAASEAADVVLCNGVLDGVPACIQIAKRSRRIVWQNLIAVLAGKGLLLLLGVAGFMPVWLAAILDALLSCGASYNGLRAYYGKETWKALCKKN